MSKLKNITVDKYIALAIFIMLLIIPFVSSLYSVQIFGKFITYIILALGLDILWGEAGLMNLGFAIFFGIGSYIFGISMAIQKGLPAFMSFGGITELPWFFAPLQNPASAIILSVAVPIIIALLLGYFIFKSQIKGVFYNIITLAFVALFELFIVNQQTYTGGASGINGIATGVMTLRLFGSKITIIDWYYIAFISLIFIYLFCLWLHKIRFGQIIHAIRDNEPRVQFLSYDPAVFKTVTFAISAAVAGYAGMLYVPIASFVSIDSSGVMFSTMVIIWLAVGGRGNFTGAMVGALLVNFLQNTLSGIFGGMWQIILGICLLLIVMLMPKGLIGSLVEWQYMRRVHGSEKKETKITNREAEV
ncbi:ABC transporter permease subunit [Pectinatus haikarae]|uniref:Urea transport system permease protein n=1 Tax=Pectinatus haikarae TaxID=349096 RepID=A0ABT9Y7K8_9FIRM|nr:branched-chain amino acid ABC transporter permease [Pectinatus haikarae]MDQ0203202.1 urea transport system permease protein [Pectinatus haikarae]